MKARSPAAASRPQPSAPPARTVSSPDEAAAIPGIVREVIASPGAPLDATSRTLMEARFGHDFGRVRVHADARAAASARVVDAVAYTVGRSIAFGEGRYAPATRDGRRLLAHELAHVVQQGQAVARPLGIAPPDTPLERDAERAADAVAREAVWGSPARISGSARYTVLRTAATRETSVLEPPATADTPHSVLDAPRATPVPSTAPLPAAWLQRSPLSDAVRADVEKAAPPRFDALLDRLGDADVQGDQTDADVDAEIARLLAGRPDEVWLAQRVRQGQLGRTTGARGPKVRGRPVARPVEVFFFRGVTARRALVIAGVHGTERQGIEVARCLIADLQTQQPHFTVIVVPTLFPDNAAVARFGSRESGATPTNRNFPQTTVDLETARKAGGVDAQGRAILPENLMLMELMERFRPERIISIHGTHQPSAAGIFYDTRALREDEVAAARQWAAERAYVAPRGRVHYPPEGEEEARRETMAALLRQRLRHLAQQASDVDRALSLKASARIDVATAGIKAAGRTMGRREDDPKTVPEAEQEAREAHPSVAGNVGATGALDRATWSGGVPGGVSLGGYAPPRGMSVFTVEPAINRNTADYPTTLDPTITVDDRRVELQAYADAVRTVLLGPP